MIFSGAPFSDLPFSDLPPDPAAGNPFFNPPSSQTGYAPVLAVTALAVSSLLCSTLAPVVVSLLPSRAAHSAWLQVQQVRHINADTSRGMAKVLYGDQVPPRVGPPFFGPQQHRPNEWLNPDTSKGTAKVLYGDQVPPFKPAPNFGPQQHPINEWLSPNTSLGEPLALRTGFVQPPLNVAPNFPPLRFWWQPSDTSQGTPELYKQEAIPPGDQWTRTAPEPNRSVVDTSKPTWVGFFPIPLPPGEQNQVSPSIWFNVTDTSRGTTAPLFPAPGNLPPGESSFVSLPDHQIRMVVNTSYGTTAPLFPFVQQPNPPGQAAWVGLQRFWWQPADTSSGIPEGYRRESVPTGDQWTATAPEPNRTVWDTGKAAYPVQYPFVVPPYNGVPSLARYQEREYNRPRIPFPVFAGYITPPVVNPTFFAQFKPLAAYRRDYPTQQPARAKQTISGATPPIVLVPDMEFYQYVPKRVWKETIKARPWVEYVPKRRWSTKFQEIPTVSIGPKDPVEVVVVSIDFTEELGTESIVTQVCAASLVSGTDPNPSAILSGLAGTSGGTIVTQGVIGGLQGCTYEIKATITTSGLRTLVGATVLPMVVE